jgi:phosphohistidine phosphatase
VIVYFVRHASAGQHMADPAKDQRRALDREGIEQCGLMGRALAALDAHVDAVISSPLKRATQTASLIGNELGYEGKLQLDPALAPDASFDQFRRLLQKYSSSEAILIVGHNPNFSDFLGTLISPARNASRVELKKAAVAKVELDNRAGILKWCITPKLVRTLYDTLASSSRLKTSRK